MLVEGRARGEGLTDMWMSHGGSATITWNLLSATSFYQLNDSLAEHAEVKIAYVAVDPLRRARTRWRA